MAVDLNEKPWYVAFIVGLVLGIGLFVILQVYVFKDIQTGIEKTEVSIDELEREIEKGRAAKANIQKLEEDIAGYELELDRLKRILPTKRETDTLIKRLKQLTELGHFQLARFTPGDFQDQGFYWQWPIRVVLSGSYHELGQFFDRLSRFSRIINVSELQITPAQKKKGETGFTIGAAFTQLTFIYKE
jgi:type IV pilus assembly protein PilO